MSQLFTSDDQNTVASASASVLPMSVQGWFPLRLTSLISLLYRDTQESSPAPQFKGINSLALNLLYDSALTSVHDYWQIHSFVLAIVNSAAMNNGIHVSFAILVFSVYMPRSGIDVTYGGFIPSI